MEKVVKAVNCNGGKIFIQVTHYGRQLNSSFHDNKEIVAPSQVKFKTDLPNFDSSGNLGTHERPWPSRLKNQRDFLKDRKIMHSWQRSLVLMAFKFQEQTDA